MEKRRTCRRCCNAWLEAALRKLGPLAVDRLERGRLTGRVDGAPVTMSYHPYLLIDELLLTRWGVPRAGVRDLATSNLLALSEHGSRERFADLSFFAKWSIDARDAEAEPLRGAGIALPGPSS